MSVCFPRTEQTFPIVRILDPILPDPWELYPILHTLTNFRSSSCFTSAQYGGLDVCVFLRPCHNSSIPVQETMVPW